jgi:hypothetical protein
VALCFEDVKPQENGTAVVMMKRGKTGTTNTPYLIGAGALEAALQRSTSRAGITVGPVFVGLTKGGNLTGHPLIPGDVGRILRDAAKRAKVRAPKPEHDFVREEF